MGKYNKNEMWQGVFFRLPITTCSIKDCLMSNFVISIYSNQIEEELKLYVESQYKRINSSNFNPTEFCSRIIAISCGRDLGSLKLYSKYLRFSDGILSTFKKYYIKCIEDCVEPNQLSAHKTAYTNMLRFFKEN